MEGACGECVHGPAADVECRSTPLPPYRYSPILGEYKGEGVYCDTALHGAAVAPGRCAGLIKVCWSGTLKRGIIVLVIVIMIVY